jgi:DNA-binding FadR family transcriptional regulator
MSEQPLGLRLQAHNGSDSVEIVRQRRKLYEEIAAQIEAKIRSGQYPPGTQLPSERAITKTFGVGRTSVREALLALQKMGLVTVSSRARARVTQPTAETLVGQLSGAARHVLSHCENIRYLQEARAFFEISLARHAALHATPMQVAALKRALDRNEAAIGQPTEFHQTNVAFHHVLAEIHENPIFAAVHSAIWEWLSAQRAAARHPLEAHRAGYRAHMLIYAAIAAHDADGAGEAMRHHLDEVQLLWPTVRDVHTVLVVDDDIPVLDVLAKILEEPGSTVLTAHDAYEAIRILSDRHVDLLITDIRMPGLDGSQLGVQAKFLRPRVRVIYITGFAEAAEYARHGIVLQKPIRAAELIQVVRKEMKAV